MATVTRQLNAVILNDILLKNSVSVFVLEFGLVKGFAVEVALWDKSIISRDVSSHFGGTHGEFVSCVGLLCRVSWELVTRVFAE